MANECQLSNAGRTYTYQVYDYDCNGVAHKSDRIFEYTVVATDGSNSNFVMSFFNKFYPTFKSSSGFVAYFEGSPDKFDKVRIAWRSPTWKLVRIK